MLKKMDILILVKEKNPPAKGINAPLLYIYKKNQT